VRSRLFTSRSSSEPKFGFVQGVGPIGYSLLFFQTLVTAAGFDPLKGPGSSCSAPDASGQCVVPWGNGTKAVSSVVLVASGCSFAVSTSVAHSTDLKSNFFQKVMTLIFTIIGSAADYGTFGRWLLLVVTCIC